ncbi:MAG: 5-formyltetrahydrofolate cyclo-ligase [Clostridiales bacterium]|nr:5-formyltetrahydrofolate cyclo-ligase [Clostridiales bacterium]
MHVKKFTDIRVQKNLLREKSKAYRENLNPDEKERLDRKISNRFLNLWHYREADLILIFVSTEVEVDTYLIMADALQKGKRVAVPRCVEGTRNIEYYLIDSPDDLEPGTFGVPEPNPQKNLKLTEFDGAVCVVPALVYDKSGFRIGFGKGYFDRFLSSVQLKTIGLIYDACLLDSVPRGKYDKRIDMIVTESKILDFSGKHV